jgi:hypothetical protein
MSWIAGKEPPGRPVLSIEPVPLIIFEHSVFHISSSPLQHATGSLDFGLDMLQLFVFRDA